MGEIEKVQRINPALNTINSTQRVGERAERHGSHREEKRKPEEDRIELHQEAEDTEPAATVSSSEVDGGLDIAI